RFTAYIGAFIGLSPQALRDRDTVPDVAKLFHVGSLIRQVRNAEGLAAILGHFFRVPVTIQEFVGYWMRLGSRERTYLAREGATLGMSAVRGRTVWDRHHRFRIRIGPLTPAKYKSFLPAAPHMIDGPPTALEKLIDWVRLYGSLELEWDVR